jgi:hypothetical protein
MVVPETPTPFELMRGAKSPEVISPALLMHVDSTMVLPAKVLLPI